MALPHDSSNQVPLDDPAIVEELRGEIARLEKRLLHRELELEQAVRAGKITEALAARGKRTLIQKQADLEATIAELRFTTDALVEAREAAEAAADARGRFLAVVSHEMRTPMNGILGTLQILSESEPDRERSDLLELALRSADSLLELIHDVLDFSKAEAGKLQLECQPFDLHRCVRDSVSVHASTAQRKGLRLEIALAADVPRRVEGDLLRLRQVLLNLLGNAVKFTPEGSVILRVSTADGGKLRFEVEDTGVGIAPDALQVIFQAFRQAESGTTRSFDGIGLGLSICHHLVGMMEGELNVESEPGQGAKFAFDVHLPKVYGAETQAQEDPVAINPSAPLRVLVVDDQLVNRKVAESMLRRLGAEAVSVEDGAQAVEAVRASGGFDLVLMDCTMPVMDGFEATRQIRALEEPVSHIRIVALTALSSVEDRQRCIDSGMNGFMGKPVKLEGMREILSETRRAA